MKTFQKIKSFDNLLKFEEHLRSRGGEPLTYEAGDDIIITEKIDGANAQVLVKDGQVLTFSHHKPLTEDNTLNGFYGFVNEREAFKNIPEGYAVFGEWLVPHRIKYKESAYKSYYVFDVFNFWSGSYLGFEKAKEFFYEYLSDIENVVMVPLLAKKQDIAEKDLVELQKEYEEKSRLSIDGKMEGIVVSDLNKIVDIDEETKGPLRTKLVNEAFKETSRIKAPRTKEGDELVIWMQENITEARIRKQYFSLLEFGDISAVMDFSWMQNGIAKLIGEKVLSDAIEESEELPELLLDSSPSKEKSMKSAQKFANKATNKFIALTIKGLI